MGKCAIPQPDHPTVTCTAREGTCARLHTAVLNGELIRWPNEDFVPPARHGATPEELRAMAARVAPVKRAAPIARDRSSREFDLFHRAHPEVLAKLLDLTRDLVDAGEEQLSVSMLWETLRYHFLLTDAPHRRVSQRLSADYRRRYVEILEREHPEVAHHLATRARASV